MFSATWQRDGGWGREEASPEKQALFQWTEGSGSLVDTVGTGSEVVRTEKPRGRQERTLCWVSRGQSPGLAGQGSPHAAVSGEHPVQAQPGFWQNTGPCSCGTEGPLLAGRQRGWPSAPQDHVLCTRGFISQASRAPQSSS